MGFRITEDGAERDIADILERLKQYNLSKCEPSQDMPLGVFFGKRGG